MATYCVTYSKDDNWGQPEDRFKTRPPADARFHEARAAGRFARLIRWENNQWTEVDPADPGAVRRGAPDA